MKTKKVIDGDNMRLIEWFNPKDLQKVLKRYRESKKWVDVGVDVDGDIIVYKD